MRTALFCASLVTGLIALPSAASAQDVQAMRQEIDQLRRDIERLNQEYAARLAALEAKLAAADAAPPAVAAPAVSTASQAAAASSKVFNPDMAVIGDFLGAVGKNPVQADPFALGGDHPNALQMHESEASFQAVVDPYARADFFVSFGEEGVELEEGFITFTSLPGGLLTRVGKMRAAFGKVNALHNHVLSWADRPLVTQNLVGGEDGIDDAGISVARLIPNPWLFLEATGQVFRGDSGAEGSKLFAASKRGDVSYVGHLRAYQDITENANIDLGLSYARGHNGIADANATDDASLLTQLYGVDATFRWRPLQRSIYRSFMARTEWIRSRRDQPETFGGPQQADGMYVSGDYQFARRWSAGARVDRSAHADNAALTDTGASLLLTYWPSEFSQVRAQYRRTNYGIGEQSNELLFQFQFSIGAHGAHPF